MAEKLTAAPDRVILSVKLASGDFESSVSISVDATDDAKNKAVLDWLQLVVVGLRTGVEQMAATLGRASLTPHTQED